MQLDLLPATLQARTLGPWSSAVELVNAREAAAEQRRQKMAGLQVDGGVMMEVWDGGVMMEVYDGGV